MSFKDRQRYQDIAIINCDRAPAEESTGQDSNPILRAVIVFLSAALFMALGYIICLKTGILAPPAEPCCFGVLELDFDFEFDAPTADT